MPTGYTHSVQEGKTTEFADYALQCARAFGALIMLRDEPSDAPVPKTIEAQTEYYDGRLKESSARLEELEAMTPAQMQEAATEDFNARVAAWHGRRTRKVTEKSRYEAMLEKARAWTPPTTEHAELKSFMEDQLLKSIDFDCRDSQFDPEPASLAASEWHAKAIAECARDVEYATEGRAKEISLADGRNAWLSALRKSL